MTGTPRQALGSRTKNSFPLLYFPEFKSRRAKDANRVVRRETATRRFELQWPSSLAKALLSSDVPGLEVRLPRRHQSAAKISKRRALQRAFVLTWPRDIEIGAPAAASDENEPPASAETGSASGGDATTTSVVAQEKAEHQHQQQQAARTSQGAAAEQLTATPPTPHSPHASPQGSPLQPQSQQQVLVAVLQQQQQRQRQPAAAAELGSGSTAGSCAAPPAPSTPAAAGQLLRQVASCGAQTTPGVFFAGQEHTPGHSAEDVEGAAGSERDAAGCMDRVAQTSPSPVAVDAAAPVDGAAQTTPGLALLPGGDPARLQRQEAQTQTAAEAPGGGHSSAAFEFPQRSPAHRSGEGSHGGGCIPISSRSSFSEHRLEAAAEQLQPSPLAAPELRLSLPMAAGMVATPLPGGTEPAEMSEGVPLEPEAAGSSGGSAAGSMGGGGSDTEGSLQCDSDSGRIGAGGGRGEERHARLKKMHSRKSLAGAGLKGSGGIRRSTRQRRPPLQYWRGEYKQYERRHQSLPTVVDYQLRTPDPVWPHPDVRHPPDAAGTAATATAPPPPDVQHPPGRRRAPAKGGPGRRRPSAPAGERPRGKLPPRCRTRP